MDGSSHLLSIDTLKTRAKRLRVSLETDGRTVCHGKALELLAHQHGYADWNILFAAAGNSLEDAPPNAASRHRYRMLFPTPPLRPVSSRDARSAA